MAWKDDSTQVRSVEEGSEHRLPRREWREIVLREQAGALPERGVEIRFSDTTLRETSETRPQPLPARRLHLRRETNQGPFLQHLGRGDYPRTVLDAPVLAVVAARALAAEGFLGRSAARGAGADRPGRDRPLPQPVVVNLTHYMTRSATRRRSAASSPASDTLKYKTALASYAPT